MIAQFTTGPIRPHRREVVSRGCHHAFVRPSAAVRTRRHQWLGHIMRMHAGRLVRRAVLALGQRAGPPYQPGRLLMDKPLPLNELVQRVSDHRG